jgi:hypothetical protein
MDDPMGVFRYLYTKRQARVDSAYQKLTTRMNTATFLEPSIACLDGGLKNKSRSPKELA